MTADRASLREALSELAQDRTRRPLLLALDFDGSLAPLVDDPAASRMLPDAATAVIELARSNDSDIHLALVSGRRLGDLHRLTAPMPPGTRLVGSHGAERGIIGPAGELLDGEDAFGSAPDGVPTSSAADAALRDRARDLADRLEAATTAYDGVWVERKPYNAVVHTRLAGAAEATVASAIAVTIGETEGAKVVQGKDVVELGLVRTDKGEAIDQLREIVGAATVLYAGDDRTDEDAFAVLDGGDVAIKVGEGESRATLRAHDPTDLCSALLTFVREAVAVAR